jgi:cell wall-associated NlpC family hydrolase
MKTMHSIAAILLLAGCASSPRVAVERPPAAQRIIERPPVTPRMIDSAPERPWDLERFPAAQRSIGNASERARGLVLHARRQIGAPYRYGGSSPQHGFDCSGLVRYVYKQAGIVLPRTTEAMSEVGFPVTISELEPGDLVFFDTRRKPFSHVGIYIGERRFIHAPASGGVVQLVDMRARYWHTRYVGARRVVS